MQEGASGAGLGPTRLDRRRVMQGAASFALVVAIFAFVIPRFADYSDVWGAIEDMTWFEVTTLTLVSLWNIVTYWFVLVAVLPGLRLREAGVVNQGSTAIANTVPGGGALGVGVTYAMYNSWGFTKSEIALSVLVSGIWNNFAKLGFPVVALALLAIQGDAGTTLAVAGLLGVVSLVAVIVGFGLVLRSERLAHTVGVLIGRAASWLRRLVRRDAVTGWGEAAVAFRDQAVRLLRQRWLGLSAATLISHTSIYLVLLVALRHVGVSGEQVSWIEVLAAYAFIRLISALPITPGGLGVVELGLVATLQTGLDDMAKAQVVAAVLVFRVMTFFLPVPFGVVSYLFWRRNKSWRKEPAARAAGRSQGPATTSVSRPT